MKKYLVGITALALLLVFITGCNGVSTSMQSTPLSGMGMLKVYVTDAPDEIAECSVTVKSLEVHKTGGSWVTLYGEAEGEVPKTFELIGLGDGNINAFLTSKVVASGWYTQLRLDILDNVKIKLLGNEITEYNARLPGGKIKLVGPFEVKENGETQITLDFDVAKSVHEIVAENKEYSYIFKPVIKLDVIEALEITTPSLPNGGVDTPYNATLEAIDGTPPYTWSISAGTLPLGFPVFSLDSTTGVISGTPTTAGDYTFTVQVTDSSGTPQDDTQELIIHIED